MIKNYLRSFPWLISLRQRLRHFKYEWADIRDSLSPFLPFQAGIKGETTPYGFVLCGSATSMHHEAMRNGEFEPEETSLLLERLAASEVFVDVGANIGFYTCLARHAGKAVVAIEPQTKNLKMLYRNLLANNYDDVEVFPMGVARAPGLVKLYGPSGTGASMIAGWAHQHDGYSSMMPLTTLDYLLSDRFVGQKLLIKIDVEGAEQEVLQGAEKLLRRTPQPVWMLEICLNEYHPDGMNPNYEATFETFWRHGYVARVADSKAMAVTREDVRRWVRAGRTETGAINYLFFRPSESE
jgi:FkbM family methyltransferase